MELSALVWICVHDVDSAKYLDSAPTAKYLNIWIRLRRLCVDLVSADCGFGLVALADSAGAGFGFGGDLA